MQKSVRRTLQRAAGRHHGYHLESVTSCQKSDSVSIDVYFLEEQSCQCNVKNLVTHQS